MGDLSEALNRWQSLLKTFQQEQVYRPALTGDGSSAITADVTGRVGWAWVRYDEKQDHASQVLNWRYPGIAQGIPVMVGKRYPTDRYLQILGVNLDLYLENIRQESFVQYVLPRHGDSHHGRSGNDPAPIDVRNLAFGRVSATAPESLFVDVSTFSFDNDGTYQTYPGELVDFTSDLPGTADRHYYALVYMDPDTNAAGYVLGDAVPITISPIPPSAVLGTVPLGLVKLENGITAIYESDIYDYRIVFQPLGGNLDVINQTVGALEAEFDFILSRHIVQGL